MYYLLRPIYVLIILNVYSVIIELSSDSGTNSSGFSTVEYQLIELEANVHPLHVARDSVRLLNSNSIQMNHINAFMLAFYGRSPLNIVHAGFDIIRADMRPMEEGSSLVVVSAENAEMIEQIFTASQTAIDILDDLLQYEHIDSGRQTICGWMNV